MNDYAINVENVSKRYRLQEGSERTLKASVLNSLRGRKKGRRDFWALRDINLNVKRGETLGIIGSNGAGKSTLLKILTGTVFPTTGQVAKYGKVSALLELGAGFHPDLSGRENVYLCGAILGLSRRQMAERFDAIVSFAGIGDFIDQPVKHYSSGMYVRLGFAVAVEVDPDILLIDEVLAVGDAAFQQKCLEKMRAFRKQGKTLLIISHDLATIQSISDRILLLDKGRIAGEGDPEAQVTHYQDIARDQSIEWLQKEWGSGEAKITGVEFFDAAGKARDRFRAGEAVTAKIKYKTDKRIDLPVFGFSVADAVGKTLYGSNTQIEKFDLPYIEGEGSIELVLTDTPLSAQVYLFSFSIHSCDHKINYHRLDHKFPLTIENDKHFDGYIEIPCRWGKS